MSIIKGLIQSTCLTQVVNAGALRIALIGDSITDQHTSYGANIEAFENVGWFNVVNYKMRDRFIFNEDLNFGISGDDTSEMDARKTDMAAQNPDIVFVLGGTNDISAQATPASIIANLDSIYTYITDTLGVICYALTITPRSFWPGDFDAADIAQAKADINEVNAWIKARAGIVVIDSFAELADSNGDPKAGVLSDGLHFAPLGSDFVSTPIISNMQPLYGNGGALKLVGNIFDNGDMSGTGGSLPAGCSGVLSDGFTMQTTGATTDDTWRVFSKTADDELKIVVDVPHGNGVVGLVMSERINEGSDYSNNTTFRSAVDMDIQEITGEVDTCNYEVRVEGGAVGNISVISLDDRTGSKTVAYGEGVSRVPDFTPTDSTRMRGRLTIDADTTNGAIRVVVVVKRWFIAAV